MLPLTDLRKLRDARLKDAVVLLKGKRYDGAIYLCGYAIELALKLRVCKTLHWQGFPSANNEFQGYQNFKTHDFDVLLHLSGRETKILTMLLAEWSSVKTWNPELRYRVVGSATKQNAEDMIDATRKVVKAL
jgi:hypothetical protein